MDCLTRCTPVWRQGFRKGGDELFARRVHWRPFGLHEKFYQARGRSSACTLWGGTHRATGRGGSLYTTACASVRTASLARSTIAAAGGVGCVLAWERGGQWLGGAGRGGGHLCGSIAGCYYSTRPTRQKGAEDPRATPPDAGWPTWVVRAPLRCYSTRARTGTCVWCSIPRRLRENQDRQNQADDAHVALPCRRQKVP